MKRENIPGMNVTTGVIKTGALLNLSFNVSQISPAVCAALTNAMVDVWHADALGKYFDTPRAAAPR